jgi:ferric-dicitrate binding protein FerR (iron transport regulator)
MTPRYARLASKLFVRESEGARPPPTVEARERAIAVVSAVLAARARKRRIARWSAVAAAAAIAIIGVSGARLVLHQGGGAGPIAQRAHGIEIVAKSVGDGARMVVSGDPPAPLAEGRTVPTGSRLVTPANSRATLAFSTGTTVTLGEATDLTVNADGPMQLLQLGTGFIDLHVAKLTSAQRFLVSTSDSEVEVRGTQFRVALAQPDPTCGGGTTTRVSVSEGVVVVRHDGTESRVAAGETWPCAMTTTTPAIGDEIETPAGPPHAAPSSVLAEVNALFGQAMAAKHRGDTRGSVQALDRLIARYPSCQLAENAAMERLRLLHASGSLRAVAAAKNYLSAYPHGFGRAEAEAVVAASP